MPELDNDSIAICMQALKHTIRHFDLLCQSQTVDPDDYAEAREMYLTELAHLIRIYREEERQGRTSMPLAMLLKDSPVEVP